MRDDVLLAGDHVRLEMLQPHHIDGLAQAASGGGELYQWSPVPHTLEAAKSYVETALRWQAEGRALAFATIRQDDDRIIGSSRFFDIVRWPWPSAHERARNGCVDICEIGYTWLAPDAIRTGANTEAKLLMLTHAFETWGAQCVCFHSDVRNMRSRAALLRLGAQFEGVLRSHRLAADMIPRDSARFSITTGEWPTVRQGLRTRLYGSRG